MLWVYFPVTIKQKAENAFMTHDKWHGTQWWRPVLFEMSAGFLKSRRMHQTDRRQRFAIVVINMITWSVRRRAAIGPIHHRDLESFRFLAIPLFSMALFSCPFLVPNCWNRSRRSCFKVALSSSNCGSTGLPSFFWLVPSSLGRLCRRFMNTDPILQSKLLFSLFLWGRGSVLIRWSVSKQNQRFFAIQKWKGRGGSRSRFSHLLGAHSPTEHGPRKPYRWRAMLGKYPAIFPPLSRARQARQPRSGWKVNDEVVISFFKVWTRIW